MFLCGALDCEIIKEHQTKYWMSFPLEKVFGTGKYTHRLYIWRRLHNQLGVAVLRWDRLQLIVAYYTIKIFFRVYIVSNVSKATHINMSNSYRHWDGTTPMTSLYFITVLNLLYGISMNTSMLDDACVCKRYICISANMIIQSDNIFTIYMYRFP